MFFDRVDIQLFANPNTNVTTANTVGSNDLSPTMRTYYEDRLIDMADPYLVHDQFGDKYPIPANNGKTIDFRKFSPYPKALTALTEGVTPDGRSMDMTHKTATVSQYGDYTTYSDMLEMTAVDPIQTQATKLHGSQAGRTADTITREILHGGSNVIYAPQVDASTGAETEVLTRNGLDETCRLTYNTILHAVAKLKEQNAPTFDDGKYVAIIHTNTSADIRKMEGWLDIQRYADPSNIYNGEIGSVGGVRFVETTEAKIIGASVIGAVSAATTNATTFVLKENPGADGVEYLSKAGNKIKIGTTEYTIGSTPYNTDTKTVTLSAAASLEANATVVSEDAASGGLSVYSTLFLGANAFGVTQLANGGLRYIVKQLGSAGSADPLDQRATVGWKMTKTAERLIEEYMLRVEHTVTVNPKAKSN